MRQPLHYKPKTFRHVVENALDRLYHLPCERYLYDGAERTHVAKYYEVFDFYEKRYLNPNSPERNRL